MYEVYQDDEANKQTLESKRRGEPSSMFLLPRSLADAGPMQITWARFEESRTSFRIQAFQVLSQG